MHNRITQLGILDRARFREVIYACFDLLEDLMLDRVFSAFDKNNDGLIDAVEWVEGCSIIIRGTPEELIDFSYYVYNINGDGCIDREEVFQYLRRTFVKVPDVMPNEDIEDSVKDIVELCMRKLDKDRDGQVTFKDYEKACLVDPLLVQSLGPCIPTTRSLAAFLACFAEDYRSYTPTWGDVWNRNLSKYVRRSSQAGGNHHREGGGGDEGPSASQSTTEEFEEMIALAGAPPGLPP
jgi:Ca2+-binding EF-hand superfamily protein